MEGVGGEQKSSVERLAKAACCTRKNCPVKLEFGVTTDTKK